MRAWCANEFAQNGIKFTPFQANMGFSHSRGTVRGMHYQVSPADEAKLVRCTRGSMFDVVLDLRPGSPSYRSWFGTILSAENGQMLADVRVLQANWDRIITVRATLQGLALAALCLTLIA